MIDKGRPYSKIVQQISAVKAGLDSAVQVILEDFGGLRCSIDEEQDCDLTAVELKEAVARIR